MMKSRTDLQVKFKATFGDLLPNLKSDRWIHWETIEVIPYCILFYRFMQCPLVYLDGVPRYDPWFKTPIFLDTKVLKHITSGIPLVDGEKPPTIGQYIDRDEIVSEKEWVVQQLECQWWQDKPETDAYWARFHKPDDKSLFE